jgi:hypothetical protein
MQNTKLGLAKDFNKCWVNFVLNGNASNFVTDLIAIHLNVLRLTPRNSVNFVSFVRSEFKSFIECKYEFDPKVKLMIGCLKAVKEVQAVPGAKSSVSGLLAGADEVGKSIKVVTNQDEVF